MWSAHNIFSPIWYLFWFSRLRKNNHLGLIFSFPFPTFANFFKYLGNIKKIFPTTWYYQFLVILVGILGAMEILATFACVMYMPVSNSTFIRFNFKKSVLVKNTASIRLVTLWHWFLQIRYLRWYLLQSFWVID